MSEKKQEQAKKITVDDSEPRVLGTREREDWFEHSPDANGLCNVPEFLRDCAVWQPRTRFHATARLPIDPKLLKSANRGVTDAHRTSCQRGGKALKEIKI